MKIVDVTEFYSERGGGIRSHLTSRGHVLCQLGHDHVVIAPGAEDWVTDATGNAHVARKVAPGSAPQGRTRVMRIAGPALPYDATYHLLGRFDKIHARIRAEEPDVLEAHSPYLAAAAVLTSRPGRLPVRTAFWHADHAGTYVEPLLERLAGPRAGRALGAPLRLGIRALLAGFDATFVAGRGQARRLREVGVKDVVLAPFGVDRSVFDPARRSAARRRALLGGLDGDATLLVGVGRLAFEKRWDVVLESYARIRSRRKAALVLFGDGPELQRLRERAPPGVTFAGFETDRGALAEALASADVLVHGCPYETFGLGVAEAVACGLPVVVPDAGGAPESADPASGEVYRSLDAEACAAAIERLLGRDPAELRAKAVQAAAAVPTDAQHVAGVVAAYDDLRRARR